jgi:hypothetical protein
VNSAIQPSGRALTDRAAVPYCRNCGAPLAGEFCADCGQKGDVHVPTTMELMHEALEGITHSDSRLWVSLKYLLVVPGKLTTEFVAGRRVSYLPPFRLYLVLSVAFFLLTSISHTSFIEFDASPASSARPATAGDCRDLKVNIFGKSGEEQRFRQACEQIVSDHGRNFQHTIVATIPKAMFIFLPLIAFFHMLLYWRPRHRYAEHLLFFVHMHAFAFLVMTLMLLLEKLGESVKTLAGTTDVLIASLGVYIPVYIVLAMRRVFKRGWLGISFKAGALFLIYVTVLAITMAGVVIYAIYQL